MKNSRINLVVERYFLYEPNVYMNLMFTVDGDVAPEKLVEAVRKSYTQNQTTMSKAVLDDKGDLYLEEMEESGCHVYVDSRDWEEIQNEQERIPFHLNEGEFLRTFIIPKGENTDVFLMAHHMLCDGTGLFFLLEDIMNNLSGNEVTYKPTVVLKKGEARRKGNLAFKQRFLLSLVNKKWKKEKKIFTWDDYYKIHETYWKNKRTQVKFTVIEGEELENLLKECKALNVTVNSYLMAKILQDYPQSHVLGIPVSLRKGQRSVSNFVSNLRVLFDYDPQKSYQENAVALDQIVRPMVKDEAAKYQTSQFLAIMEPTLLDAALMYHHMGFKNECARIVAEIVGYYGEKYTDLGLSNMKIVDIPTQYGDYKISNIVGFPPSLSAADKVLGAFTFDGKMTIIDTTLEEI